MGVRVTRVPPAQLPTREQQVRQDQRVLPVTRVPQEILQIREQQVPPVGQDVEALQARLVRQEKWAPKDIRGFQV